MIILVCICICEGDEHLKAGVVLKESALAETRLEEDILRQLEQLSIGSLKTQGLCVTHLDAVDYNVLRRGE